MKQLISLLLFVSPCILISQFSLCDNPTYSLVADLDTTYAPKDVDQSIVEIDGVIYYSFDDGVHGNELWRSDGTNKGTYMVSDIYTGDLSSNPSNLTEVNGLLMFSAISEGRGYELWIYAYNDLRGSPQMLIDISVGPTSSQPNNFHVLEDKNGSGILFFSAYRNSTGKELWKSDGTKLNTKMIKDINPGPKSSYPSNFCTVGTQVFFAADDGIHGVELHRSRGTEGTTTMVKDINYHGSISYSSDPTYLVAYNGMLYFSAKNNVTYSSQIQTELWKSDGTEAGTFLLKDLNESTGFNKSGEPNSFQIHNGELYFIGTNTNASEKLWKTDGTTAGTIQVSGQHSSPSGPLLSEGGLLYYLSNGIKDLSAYNHLTSSSELLADDDYPSNPRSHNGKVYFNGSITSNDNYGELYESEGTMATTELLHDIEPSGESNPQYMTPAGDLLFFAHTRDHGYELYKDTDGSLQLVKDASSNNYNDSHSLEDVVLLGENIYIIPPIDEENNRIYRLDDSQLIPIEFESVSNIEDDVFYGFVDSTLYAYAQYSDEVFKQSLITQKLETFFDFNGAQGGIVSAVSIPNYFIVFHYNSASDEVDIWAVDGSEIFKKIGTVDYIEEYVFEDDQIAGYSNNRIFFIEIGVDNKYYIWQSDGTLDGTGMVESIQNGFTEVPFIKRLSDRFLVFDFERNVFYSTDGSASGTDSITSDALPAWVEDIYDSNIHIVNNEVYVSHYSEGLFKINEGFDGLELINAEIGESGFWRNDNNGLVLVENDTIYIMQDDSLYSINKPLNIDNTYIDFIWGQIGIRNYDPSSKPSQFIPELNIMDPLDHDLNRIDFISEFADQLSNHHDLIRVIGDQIFIELDNGIIGSELWRVNCRCSDTLTIDNHAIELGEYRSAYEITIQGATVPGGSSIFNSYNSIVIDQEFEVPPSSIADFRIGNNCK